MKKKEAKNHKKKVPKKPPGLEEEKKISYKDFKLLNEKK